MLTPAEKASSLSVLKNYAKRKFTNLKSAPARKLAKDSTKSAVFVDTQKNQFSEFSILNTMDKLGEGWGLQLVVSPSMRNWAENLAVYFDDFSISTFPATSKGYLEDALHETLRQKSFWSELTGQSLLIFDSNTIVRKPIPNWTLEYDYIGCPWYEESVSPWCRVGDGRFSMRKKSAMIDIVERCNTYPNLIQKEDVFFSLMCHLSADRYNLPALEDASRFGMREMPSNDPIGLQKPWEYHSSEVLQLLLSDEH